LTPLAPNAQPDKRGLNDMSNQIEIPIPDNPHHVRNLEKLSLLKAQGFEGSDACLVTSLDEYGLAWRDLGEETLFIYAHPSMAKRYDRCAFANDLDCKREFDWVRWQEIYDFTGMVEAEWHGMPLPMRIYDLVSYHGTENVFGSSYWEGFAIDLEA
jgi:hypothetical protein